MAKLEVLTYGFGFTSDQGGFGWSTISLLRVGDRNILIDTGPASRRALLVNTLKDHGIERGDIDTVVLTHLHWDHCQNTDLFPNARILVNPKELDYARNPARGDTSAAWYVADMMAKMKAEPISDIGDQRVWSRRVQTWKGIPKIGAGLILVPQAPHQMFNP
jgi:glyoxylase-like metal-dependent hydrolase (beta-lactamase superfamily II)